MRQQGWVVLGSVVCGLALWLLASCGGPGGGFQPVAPKGAWVSSGGEIFKDANNPWFLRNTSVVRYCVAVDANGVSASETKVRSIIGQALAYWKKQFEVFRDAALGIAQQRFVAVPCDGEEDLRFQFGYGTLSDEQRGYLRDPRQLVGVSVRTQYDEVNLRGRGFIFIASDIGPFAYQADEHFISRPWSYDGLLYRVLVHELGHVFGLPHLGEGLMSAQYPEYILQQSDQSSFVQINELGDFFLPFTKGIQNCLLGPETREWFGVPASHQCMNFTFDVNDTKICRIFFSSSAANGERKELGKVEIPLTSLDSFRFGYSRGIVIYLNKRQKVLLDQFPGASFYPGPGFVSLDYAGSYQPERGEPKPILLKLKASSHEVLGVTDGQIRPLLFYSRSCLVFAPNGSFVCLDP